MISIFIYNDDMKRDAMWSIDEKYIFLSTIVVFISQD